MRHALLRIAILSVAALAPARGQQPEDPIDSLLARYEQGDYHVIERTVTTYQEFERVRKALGYEKDGQRYGALARWDVARRPVQSVFVLELALAGHNRGWRYWLDVLEEARKFVTSRPARPGEHPSDDAFEIAWHKAAIALLLGLNRPDLVEAHGIGPLQSRMAAAPLATGAPVLVDPWIALARGVR